MLQLYIKKLGTAPARHACLPTVLPVRCGKVARFAGQPYAWKHVQNHLIQAQHVAPDHRDTKGKAMHNPGLQGLVMTALCSVGTGLVASPKLLLLFAPCWGPARDPESSALERAALAQCPLE